jgi:hypothetical protein
LSDPRENWPWIELAVGDYDPSDPLSISTSAYLNRVPPTRLLSMTYVSSFYSRGSFAFSFVDPEYDELEIQLFQLLARVKEQSIKKSDGSTLPLRWRFGFPEANLWNPNQERNKTKWRYGTLQSFVPTLGMTESKIAMSGLSWWLSDKIDTRARIYNGKASDVVSTILEEDPQIEFYEVVPSLDTDIELPFAKPADKRPTTWLKEDVLPFMVSESGEGPYVLWVNQGGRRAYCGPRPKNTIYDHEFNVGTAENNLVINWSPEFPGQDYANLGVLGGIGYSYNPEQKEYMRWISFPEGEGFGSTLSIADKNYLSAIDAFQDGYLDAEEAALLQEKYHLGKLDEGHPWKELFDYYAEHGSVTYSFPSRSVEEARMFARNAWRELYFRSRKATATLYGHPHTIGIRGGDVIKFNVITPKGRVHWSSGYYRVSTATSNIGVGTPYIISLELEKAVDVEKELS